ncbi:hypothetical protein LLS1_24520 [Leifsonia sp. LS1]|nr:hypothetical protein LLS1_24520 [Leifsonia sp. LS1]
MLRSAAQFVSALVLARLTGPGGYGLGAIVVAAATASELIRFSGFTHAIIQSPTLDPRRTATVHYVCIAVAVALGAIVTGGAVAIATAIGEREFAGALPWLGLVFAFVGISAIPSALLSRALAFGALAVVETCAVLVACATSIALGWLGAGAQAFLWQAVLTAGLTTLGVLTVCPRLPWRPASLRESRTLLVFGLRSSAGQLFRYVSLTCDRVALTLFAGPAQTGLYAQASQVVTVPIGQTAGPVQRVMLPVLSRAMADPAQFRRYYRHAAALLGYVLFPVAGLCAATASPLVLVVLGPSWAESAPLIVVLCTGVVATVVTYLNSWVFVATAAVRSQSRQLAASMLVTVAAVAIASTFGATGTAIAVVGCATVTAVVGFLLARRRAPVTTSDLLSALLGPVAVGAATAVSAVAAQLAPAPDLPRLIAGVSAGAAGGLVTIFLLPHGRRTVAALVSTVRRPIAGPTQKA